MDNKCKIEFKEHTYARSLFSVASFMVDDQDICNSRRRQKLLSAQLASYGWLFADGRFEKTWSVRKLSAVLTLAGKVAVAHLVVERLARLSKGMPEDCAKCLRALVESLDNVDEVYGWQEDARTVLSHAINSGNSDASACAAALINLVASRGWSGFADLIGSRPTAN
jgi:hypothetical protein